MTVRAFLLPFALMTALLFACVKPVNDGNACFDSSECRGGSICAETVYGNYCFTQCGPEVVHCEDGEACVLSEELPEGAGGMGGNGGAGGMAGTGGMGGAGGAAGDPELWVCLPGDLENPDFVPADLRDQCDYSLDCDLGLICVCIPGAVCDPDDPLRSGPTCQRLCDPSMVNECPRVLDLQPECTDLGDGRGFCDPTTIATPR
jgi:hypothetical protein